ECRSQLKLLLLPMSLAMSRITNFFKMTKDEFRFTLARNAVLRRTFLNFLDGMAQFGIRIPQPAGAPLFVIVSVTQQCNLRCSHCYNEEYVDDSSHQSMDANTVRHVINQMSDAGCLGIGFNGGEPTLRSDLCDLISYAASKDIIPLIGTNGILINKDYARSLRESGLLYAQVSLDGTADTHDSIRGVKGTYEKTLDGIRNLVDEGIYVSVAMVATKKNWKEVPHVLEVAKSYGASKFEILDFQNLGRAKEDSELELDPLERDALAEDLCMRWREIIKSGDRISLLYKNPSFVRSMHKIFPHVETVPFLGVAYPKEAKKRFTYSQRLKDGIFSVQDPFSPIATCCEAGLYGFFIDVDGTMTPCPYMPLSVGNINENSLHQIWYNSPVLNALRDRNNLGKSCAGCNFRDTCAGCRARAYNLTGDYMASDPLCSRVSL
ncbi:MAG: radical SAM protein, partial [Candidatus Thermoplasmatota archaeon]|nr:radical SAM protein [Candidatus Thermoplasmatota archaeon]